MGELELDGGPECSDAGRDAVLRVCSEAQHERTPPSGLRAPALDEVKSCDDERWDCWLDERDELEDARLSETRGTPSTDDDDALHSPYTPRRSRRVPS